MDYYKVLGVSKKATQGEVKKSYRELALKHHPDRNPDNKDSEEKLKEINEAYSILSDPQKRSSYDRFGMRDPRATQGRGPAPSVEDIFSQFNFGDFSFSQRQRSSQRRGVDIKIDLPITLSQSILGCKKEINVSFTDNCSACQGRGYTQFVSCEDCDGRGQVMVQHGGVTTLSHCASCRGVGQFPTESCATCAGKKFVPVDRSLRVTIPPGCRHGTALSLSGQGQSGTNGGPAGDVLVRVKVSYPSPDKLTDEQKEFLERLDEAA